MTTSPRWTYWLCCLLVAVAFLMFVFTLDRYPPFFFDEPWWNNSAVRYLDGRSFAYMLHTQTPHPEVFSPHGPFFFRLQILTFKLLGVSHFACRIPSFAGAHLAVLLLGLFLIRKGLWRTAVMLGVLWIGDRATQQIMLGRPEGVASLFVSLGFICLVKACTGEKQRRWMLLAGCCTGLACGVNPACAFFGIAAAIVVILLKRSWLPSLSLLAIGVLPAAICVLLCWLPDPVASYKQFMWYYTMSTWGGDLRLSTERLLTVWKGMSLARFWIVLQLVFAAISLMWVGVHSKRLRGRNDPLLTTVVAASVYAALAFAMFFNSSLYSYYLVLVVVWPVIAALGLVELNWDRWVTKHRVILAGVAMIVLICWLPSLFWNVMRCREAVLWHRILDKSPMSGELARHIPSKATVMGDPDYFIVARNAGLTFTPLPWYRTDKGIRVSNNVWLVVSPRFVGILNQASPSNLEGRPLVYSGTAFAGSTYTEYSYLIYGEKTD